MYNVSNQIKIQPSMIRSNLCDYSDVYIHVKGIITVPNTSTQRAAPNNRNKEVISKNCQVYGKTIEINQFYIIMTILLIFLPIAMIVYHSNWRRSYRKKQETIAQNMLK